MPGSQGIGPIGWRKQTSRWLGFLVGWGSIVVGIAGLLWHLNGDFFQQQTLKNLVYTAPFVAPLAYTGIGLVIILDRMVDARSLEWSRWVILLAAGGFAGNFVLSLADHAQNGFFYPSEWIGVVAGAVAVGFLVAAVIVPDEPLAAGGQPRPHGDPGRGRPAWLLPSRQGQPARPGRPALGSLHLRRPDFAPLLFADLALLAVLGLWAQARYLATAGEPLVVLERRPDLDEPRATT